jgi:glycosyltransferase involved in cell wall biosynthesis
MKIAQVAPLAESVPPKLYGGTERVVSWLSEELVSLGHDVTLFASGDSNTSGSLVPVIPRALRLGRPRRDPMAAMTLLLESVAEVADEFDIIHCHIDLIQLPLFTRLGVPSLTTMHGRLDLAGLPEVIQRFPGASLVSISDSQRRPLPDANWLGTIYHGLPANLYRPSFQPGQYLAFLGRVSPEKGADTAIRLATQSRIPLHIAAKIPRTESRYYKEVLRPLIDHERVHFTGELDDAAKGEFLRNATALLFPIRWPEPFGLVMIEAMACGTPTVAYRCGSVPEVVDQGITGFVVTADDEALEAISRVETLDRRAVRERFEVRFTATQMAQNYVRVYTSLLDQRPTPVEAHASGPTSEIPSPSF